MALVLGGRPDELIVEGGVVLMNEAEARQVTDAIRSNLDDLRRTDDRLYQLLMLAYEREAWKALGYGSWREYAVTEYRVSQAHAYRLLDQARVVHALEAATGGISPMGEISERQARWLKPYLDAVTAELRRLVSPKMTSDEVREVASALIEQLQLLPAGEVQAGDRVSDDSCEVRLVRSVETIGEEVVIQDATGDCLIVNLDKELLVLARSNGPAITKPNLGDGVSHPARFSFDLLGHFRELLAGHHRVLDPFAGTGRIHELRPDFETVGIEIEPEWAQLSPHTRVGDALKLRFADGSFDAICTSPTYGNRMADHYEASDAHLRRSYMHDLGHALKPNNSGRLQWGDKYRDFHRRAWTEAIRVLTGGGVFVLNIKDHIRDRTWQDVAGWHLQVLAELGLELTAVRPVVTDSLHQGANGELRVDAELVVAFRKVAQ